MYHKPSPRLLLLLLASWLVLAGVGTPIRAEEAESSGDDVPSVAYLDVPAIAVPVMKGPRVTKYVILSFKLELADDSQIPAVEAEMPRLRDAFLLTVYTGARERSGGQGDIDLPAIRKRLLQAARAITGEAAISDILFTGTQSLPA